MPIIEYVLLGGAALLLISVVASKASGKLGVPVLLLFLGVGMIAGSEGLGGIEFTNAWAAQTLGVVALIFILFSGGLDTDWQGVRRVLWKGLALATVGVVLTAGLLGLLAGVVLPLSLLESLLLGAIVSSTDAAAVFGVMRAGNLGLKPELKRLLEFESGSNDPMAIFLTVGLIGLLMDPGASGLGLVWSFVLQMTLGAALGYGMGRLMIVLINRLNLDAEGLYPVLTLSLVVLTYAAAAVLGGNGFLAVYLAGLVLGDSDFIHKRSLMRFHDGLAWLMQIAMFLTLGLLVFPSRLLPVAGAGLLLAGFLMIVARPVSVYLTLAFSGMSGAEKAMVSWAGLRGAVPIILATFPLLAGLPEADLIFNVVFFIVLTSVLLQGTTLGMVAQWLHVDAPAPSRRRAPLEYDPTSAQSVKSALEEIEVPPASSALGKQIVELGLPDNALIVLIGRGDDFIAARGATVLQPHDRLLVLADRQALAETRRIVEAEAAEA